MRTVVSVLSVGALLLTSSAIQAKELSYVSGVYQSESTKVQNNAAGGEKTFEVGARYSDQIDAQKHWLIGAALSSVKHEAAKGSADPDDDNGFQLEGGLRWFMPNLSEKIRPLIQGRAGMRNTSETETSTTTSGTTTTTTETKHEITKLFYATDLALKFDVSPTFFFDLEVPLFESALYEIEKKSTETGGTKTETKTSKFDVYFKTYGALAAARVGLGIKF